MPPRSPDGVWRFMAALLEACDVATDPERHASPLWLSAVADITDNLLTELDSTGREVEVVADTEAAVPLVAPSQLWPQAHGHHHAIDDAAAKLEELVIQEHVAWTKRRTGRNDEGRAGAPSSSAAVVEALIGRAARILARSMELQLLCPEESTSDSVEAKMSASVLRRVVGRWHRTTGEDFHRSIHAPHNEVFEIKLDSSFPAPSDMQTKFFVLRMVHRNAGSGSFAPRSMCSHTGSRPMQVLNRFSSFPAPSDMQRRFFDLRMEPNISRFLKSTGALRCSAAGTLTDEKRALQVQPSRDRRSRRKGITRDDLSKLLQEWVSEDLRHECEDQITQSNIYGREDIQEGITKQLLSNDNRGKFNVICLSAKRGFGKTALVHSVYNDQKVSDAFDLRLWICMSEMFDEKSIIISIVEHATQVQCDLMELKLLWQLAKDELSERKFLLVLEDCHTEHHRFWKIIRRIMEFGGKRSAIIITTKNEEAITWSPVYKLSPLRDEHCLQLLQQFTLIANHDLGSDHGRTRMNHISHNCGGNPMYLKAIIRLLCHAESALQQLRNLRGVLRPDLKLCCDLLPQHLKLCLSFCSLFPKDYVFSRHHLTRLWMSLGSVNHDELESPEEICARYFKELLCRSFFEHSPSHENQEDKYVMPKSFHDIVTSISKDICLRSKDILSEIPEKIRHMSLVPLDRRTIVTLHPVTKQVESLDAFLVVNKSELQNNSMSLPFLKLEGLDDFFLKFKSIRALNLSYTVIDHLPCSIGNLKNLRYLAINNTNIRTLPHELCWLKKLQTLEVRNCLQLVTLPEDTSNLTELRHLDVSKQTGYVRMPFSMGELIHLQTLPMFHVGRDLCGCSIRDLRDLDNLHGDLTITGLENVHVGSDAREANLINKKYLETLTLQWNDNNIYLEEEDEENSADVLESLQPPSDLENLIVRNYSGSLFPIWIEKCPYENLQSITFDSCYNCCMLPTLGDLQSLRYLCLRRLYTLKTFGSTSLSEETKADKFPALELLKLWEMYELEEWTGVEDGDFPRLQNVSIYGCPILKSLPCLPSLVDLSLFRCNQLLEIPELVKLKSLKIEGLQDMVSLDLPPGLPVLKNLEIIRCDKLVSLVGLSSLSSVERLKIVKCPNIDVVNDWQKYHFKKITTSRDTTVIST